MSEAHNSIQDLSFKSSLIPMHHYILSNVNSNDHAREGRKEIAQWVHHMKDQSDDPSHHERTLLPWSYISLPHARDQVLMLNSCLMPVTIRVFK